MFHRELLPSAGGTQQWALCVSVVSASVCQGPLSDMRHVGGSKSGWLGAKQQQLMHCCAVAA